MPTSNSVGAANVLRINNVVHIHPQNAGLFVSAGHGRHADRVLSSYELILVASGRLGLYEDGRDFSVGPNQSLLLWPGRRHGGMGPFPKELRFYWIHFNYRAESQCQLCEEFDVPQTATLTHPEKLIDLYRRFLGDQESATLTRLEASLLVTLMLLEVSRAGGSAQSGQNMSELAESVLHVIDSHYNERLCTSEVAKRLHYNPDYLGRAFREDTGRSITETINRRRIRESRALLADSHMNIREIAYACGFSDPGYFRKVFRSLCGMSPRQYRKLYSHLHINTH